MKQRCSILAAAAISLAGLLSITAPARADTIPTVAPRTPTRILMLDPATQIGDRMPGVEPQQGNYRAAWRAYLAQERALQIQRLSAYAEAGIFPRNDVQPGMLNIFVDPTGVRCGMANLVYLSGHPDLVSDTARTNNATRLGEVTSGPLMEWMLTSGLTQEEAAFVQEPDFRVDRGIPAPVRQEQLQAETQRLQDHFRLAVRQLRANTRVSLAIAFHRLGERVNTPPPPVA